MKKECIISNEVISMERQYTRIDFVRKLLDDKIKCIEDEEIKRCAYVHLYGVGQAAAFLAMKRGYDKSTAELAEVAGMLHDYAKYIYDEEENHAEKSADCAREILRKIPEFFISEIDQICEAIFQHSNKMEAGTFFDEILKDADEMQHYFRNPMEDYFYQKERTQNLLKELGIKV